MEKANEAIRQALRAEAQLEVAQRLEAKNAELEQANEAIRQAMQELRASEVSLMR